MKRHLLAWIGLALLATPGTAGATDVIGNLNVDTVWTQAGSPYVLTGDVTVQPQASLTIEPGVVVQAAASDGLGSGNDATRVELVVRGRLLADGSLAEPIRFEGPSAVPGGWYGILIDTGAGASSLTQVQIAHAEQGLWMRGQGALALSDLQIEDCATGLLWQTSATLLLERSRIARIEGSGVRLEGDGVSGAAATVVETSVSACGQEGIRVADGCELDLQRSRLLFNLRGAVVDAGGALSAVNNLIAGNQLQGLLLEQTGDRPFWIVNNTIDRNVADPADPAGSPQAVGLAVTAVADPAAFVVRNNLITNHGGFGIQVLGAQAPSLDHNDVWGNGGNYDGVEPGAGSVSVNPLYVEPLGGDATGVAGPWLYVSQPVSVRNPGSGYSNSWLFVRPGAGEMRLRIPYLSTEGCCDILRLYGRSGSFAQYSGSFVGTSAATPGSYIRAEFTTDGSVNSVGFDIDGYEWREGQIDFNYRLQQSSPAIDAGNDLDAPAEDADSTARPYDGDVDGTPTTDLGAYEWHENIGPLAVAGPDHTVLPGTTIDFDAGASHDPDGTIVAYEWDFGDGSGTETGVQVSHRFDTLGDYQVSLTVTDDQAATGSDTAWVHVADNLQPVADAGPDQYVDVGEVVSFDGGNSADPDGTVVAYAWDFGDGSPVGAGRTVTHTYAHEGVFTVELTVTDNRGAVGVDDCAVVVGSGQNQPPVADAGGPYGGQPGQDIAFDGSGSSDPDGSIVAWVWDFGDGQGGSGAQPTHAYAQAGSFLVRLTVTDDGGATDDDSVLVTVSGPANQPPVAEAGGPYDGQPGQAIAFDGSASSDPDGSLVSFDWDFGDGQGAAGDQVEHTYQAAGNFLVRLVVVDDGGLSDEDTSLVTVRSPGNEPPTAEAGEDRNAEVGESLLFDAAGSSDPDGTLVSFEWDFGDGQSASGQQASHAYQTAGTFLVRLTVTDDDAAVGQDVALVTVSGGAANQPPVADAGGNQRVELGQAVLLDASDSSDPDGSIAAYAWDLGDGSSDSGPAVQHTYAQAGSYLVRLEVVDDAGATDEDFALIEVIAPEQDTPSDSGCGCRATEPASSGGPFGLAGLLLGVLALLRRRIV